MSSINPLGRHVNLGTSAGLGGQRFSLRNASGVLFAVIGATTGNATVQEHTAASGGTSQNLPVITEYWTQNAGVWTRVVQAAAATITLTTGGLAAVFISGGQLSDGFSYVNISHSTASTVAIFTDLHVQRKPTNLPDVRA